MGAKYESRVDQWLTEDGLLLLECWARDFTLGEVAQKIGISEVTLWKWRQTYPEIEERISKSKEITDYRVENALLKSALGYTTTETKTILGKPDKDGNRQIRVERIEKEIPPNVTACMAWLNNRKPDQWKRNRDNMFEMKDDKSNITVNIIKHGSDKNNDNDKEEWDVSAVTEKQTKKGSAKKQPARAQEYSDEEMEWLDE